MATTSGLCTARNMSPSLLLRLIRDLLNDLLTKYFPNAFFTDTLKAELQTMPNDRDRKVRIIQEYDRVITAATSLGFTHFSEISGPDALMKSLIGASDMVKALSFEVYYIYGDCTGMQWSKLMDKRFLTEKLYFSESEADYIRAYKISFLTAVQRSMARGFLVRMLDWKRTANNSGTRTYLRFGVGCPDEASPGHRYVVEIWPPGHSSPIHAHGACDGIVWSLAGTLEVEFYYSLQSPQLTHKIEISPQHNLFTWMTPQLNQVHAVHNRSDNQVAITLHAYDGTSDHFEVLLRTQDIDQLKNFYPKCDFCEWPEAELFGTNMDKGLLFIRSVLLETVYGRN